MEIETLASKKVEEINAKESTREILAKLKEEKKAIKGTHRKEENQIKGATQEPYKLDDYKKFGQRSTETGLAGYGGVSSIFKMMGKEPELDIRITMIVLFVLAGVSYGLFMARREIKQVREMVEKKDLQELDQRTTAKLTQIQAKITGHELKEKSDEMLDKATEMLDKQTKALESNEKVNKLLTQLLEKALQNDVKNTEIIRTQQETLSTIKQMQTNVITTESLRAETSRFYRDRDRQRQEVDKKLDDTNKTIDLNEELGRPKFTGSCCGGQLAINNSEERSSLLKKSSLI